jgi:hypothetical protein
LDKHKVHVFEHVWDIEADDFLSGEGGLELLGEFVAMRFLHYKHYVCPFEQVARKGVHGIGI